MIELPSDFVVKYGIVQECRWIGFNNIDKSNISYCKVQYDLKEDIPGLERYRYFKTVDEVISMCERLGLTYKKCRFFRDMPYKCKDGHWGTCVIEATGYHGILIPEENYDEQCNELLKRTLGKDYDSYMMRHMSPFEKINYKLHKCLKIFKAFYKNKFL